MKFIASLVFLAALCQGGHLQGSEYGQNDVVATGGPGYAASGLTGGAGGANGGGSGGGGSGSGGEGGGAGGGAGGGPCAGIIGVANSTRQGDCVWNGGSLNGWVEQTERAVANAAGGEATPEKEAVPK